MSLLYLSSGGKKHFFIRLFLSILTIVAIILIPAILILYSSFAGILTEEIQNSLKALPQLMSGAFSSWHYSFMPYTTTLIQDSQVSRLTFGKDLTEYEKARGLAALDLFHLSNPIIHSVFIYNYPMHRVFSSLKGEEPADACSDPDLLSLIGADRRVQVFAYIPRKLRLRSIGSHTQEENVLSVVIGYPSITTGALKGGMVVNISETKLRDFLSQWGKSQRDQFYIIDRKGIFISHPDKTQFGLPATLKDPLFHSLSDVYDDGSLLISSQNRRLILSYATQPELGWRFVLLTPYERIMNRIYFLRNLSVLVLGTFILISVLLSLVGSRGLYRPIADLVKMAFELFQETSGKYQDQGKGNTELQLLEDSITIARANIHTYKRDQALRLLSEALMGKRPISEVQQVEPNIPFRNWDEGYTVIVIRANHTLSIRATLGSQALHEGIKTVKSLTKEHLSPDSLDVEMGDDQLCVIHKNSIRDWQTREVPKLRKLLEEAFQKTGITFTAGIAGDFYTLEDLPQAYDQAARACRERFRNYRQTIFYFGTFTPRLSPISIETLNIESLLKYMNLGKTEAAITQLDRILEQTRDGTVEDFVRVVRQLVAQVEQLVQNSSPAVQQDMYDLIQSLDPFLVPETIEDVKEAFTRVIERYSSLLQYERSPNHQSLVYQVDSIIQKQLENPNLSPDGIAQKLGISTNYLRTIYKHYTGKSIADSIRTLRIQEAKRLLKETDLPIKEISLRLGFSNYNYFFTCFKKTIGTTPIAYRSSWKRKISES